MGLSLPQVRDCRTPYLDNIEAHVNHMLCTGAIVTGSRIALKGIAEVSTVEVVITQVIVASPGEED